MQLYSVHFFQLVILLFTVLINRVISEAKIETCLFTCQTCTNKPPYGCATCDTVNNFREISGTLCLCMNGYYDNIINETCLACHYSCLTCEFSGGSNCQSCDNDRTLSLSQCLCLQPYFDVGVHNCVKTTCASNKCFQCYSNQSCHSCAADRSIPVNCATCPVGKYDDDINSDCQNCNKKCLSCSINDNNCTTCQADRMSPPECFCQSGYYETPQAQQCELCSAKCVTCSIQSTNCTQCQPSRVSPPYCDCPNGTYENTSTQQCLACQTQCITCTGSSSNCTSCQPTRSSIPQCDCPDGQYQDVLTYQCKTCISRCLTCTSYSNCTSCQLDRIQDSPQCECQVGYYEDTSNYTCYACSLKCLSCEVGSHNCTSCAVMRSQQPQCDCQDGYYESLISYTCQKCNQMCSKCSKYANNCTTCPDPNYQQILNQCECFTGYTWNSPTQSCLLIKCEQQCQTCETSASICVQCSIGSHRIVPPMCQMCDDGYYDDGINSNCLGFQQTYIIECPLGCLTCDRIKCLTCVKGLVNRVDQLQCVLKHNNVTDCNDGNLNARDGCSPTGQVEEKQIVLKIHSYSCLYDSQGLSICTFCESLFCSLCKSQSSQSCQTCQASYYSNEEGFCLPCGDSCEICVQQGQCQKCIQNSTSIKVGNITRCRPCNSYEGLQFDPETQNCGPICGDGLRVQDEQCDDGNLVDGDGCSSSCLIENIISGCDYIKQGIQNCSKRTIFVEYNYADEATTTQLTINFSPDYALPNLCNYTSFFTSKQTTLLTEQEQDIQIDDKTNCFFLISGETSILSGDLIFIDITEAKLQYSEQYLFKELNFRLQTRKIIILTESEIKQALLASNTAEGANMFLLIIYLFAIFLGGFKFLWLSLEIYAWNETLYFVNVRYPENVESFFKLISWAEIFFLPDIFELNTTQDVYYQPTPQKFLEKGKNTFFISNITSNMIVIGLLYTAYPLCLKIINRSLSGINNCRNFKKLQVAQPSFYKQRKLSILNQTLFVKKKDFYFHFLDNKTPKVIISSPSKVQKIFIENQIETVSIDSSKNLISLNQYQDFNIEIAVDKAFKDLSLLVLKKSEEKSQLQQSKFFLTNNNKYDPNQQTINQVINSKSFVAETQLSDKSIFTNDISIEFHDWQVERDQEQQFKSSSSSPQIKEFTEDQWQHDASEEDSKIYQNEALDDQENQVQSRNQQDTIIIKIKEKKKYNYRNKSFRSKFIQDLALPIQIIDDNHKSPDPLYRFDFNKDFPMKYTDDMALEDVDDMPLEDVDDMPLENAYDMPLDTLQSEKQSHSIFKTNKKIPLITLTNDQDKLSFIQRLLSIVFKICEEFTQNFSGIILQIIMLSYLDFEMASMLQLKQPQVQRDPIIAANVLLAILFQISSYGLIFLIYSKVNQSGDLLQLKPYKQYYGVLYKDIDTDQIQCRINSIFPLLKKKLFMDSLVLLFDYPFLQTSFCTLSALMNILLVIYQNPFKSKYKTSQRLVGEVGIFICLSFTILFSLNDMVLIIINLKERLLTVEEELKLGWLIIGVICFVIAFQCIELLKEIIKAFRQRYNILMWLVFKRPLIKPIK